MNPKISVVVPVYNVAPYIRRSLDSICAQTFTDFEVLLIDDGSTDESPSICDEYAAKDPRFRVFHTKKHGVASARQFALEQLRGDYMASVDSDDYAEPNMLEALYAKIVEEDADVVIACFNTIKYDIKEQIDLNPPIHDYSALRKEIYNNWAYQAVWAKLFRVAKLKDCGIQFETMVYCRSDMLFIFELYQNDVKTAFTPAVVYNYVYRKDSVINQFNHFQYVRMQRPVFDVIRRELDVEYCGAIMSKMLFAFFGIGELKPAEIKSLLRDNKILEAITYGKHPKLRLQIFRIAQYPVFYYPIVEAYKIASRLKSLKIG